MDILPIVSTLRQHKITALLVVLEIALTCAIVCNAVFLIGQRLERMNMPSGVAEQELVRVGLSNIGPKADEFARTQQDLMALRSIPGVTAVASVNQVPFGNSSNNTSVRLDPDQKDATVHATTYFGEDLLQAFGTRLIAGRVFERGEYRSLDAVATAVRTRDMKAFPGTVVVTQALGERLWPGQDPLGKTIYMGKVPLRVIGVIAELVRPSIDDDALARFSMVLPIRVADGQYVLRTAPAARSQVLAAALAVLKQNNPHRVVVEKRNWDEVRSDFFQNDRAMAGILVGVIVALLVVTALGIVGLASFWVAQRRRMIGVRRALGATRRNILHYFQTENFLLATMGIALGMLLAYGINLFLMRYYELPRLPAIYLPVGAAVLWLIGQLAVLGPALRAAAVPPVVATRSV